MAAIEDLHLEFRIDAAILQQQIAGLSRAMARHLLEDIEAGKMPIIVKYERTDGKSITVSARLPSGYTD
jgi:hypothetical protein